MAERRGRGPLHGLKVVEQFGPDSDDATRAAVSFAGLLAALSGAEVVRVEPEGGDPMRHWPPSDGKGSALYEFLVQGKRIQFAPSSCEGAFLISDDPALNDVWPTERVVTVRALPASEADEATELTLMARAGLLDIFGSETIPPQPLPGHQIAYLGGLAAYNALLTAHLSLLRKGTVERSAVTLLDVALWVNWKHYLAGWQRDKSTGLRRKEDWTTLRCKDGYIALTFQDKDMPSLAQMCGDDYFLSPELGSRAGRTAHVAKINAALERWLQHYTRAEVAQRARELRLPVGPVLLPRELLQDAHLDSRAFFQLCKNGRRFPRLPVLWNGAPVKVAAQEIQESQA